VSLPTNILSSAGITGIVKSVLVVSMKSQDITYDRVDLTIWTLTEPAASIMAICIPVLYVSLFLIFQLTVANSEQANAVPRTQVELEKL
jgi:heme/copper-type cytochrome/quinol oxidase subunit 1